MLAKNGVTSPGFASSYELASRENKTTFICSLFIACIILLDMSYQSFITNFLLKIMEYKPILLTKIINYYFN